jgi:hypothetical protein
VIAIGLVGVVWWWRKRDASSADQAARPEVAVRAPHVAAVAAQHGVHGRVIAGIVVDDDHQPVRGARVHLTSQLTRARLLPEATAISDATGAFAFEQQPALAFSIGAEAPQLVATTQWIDLRDPKTKSDHVTLVLHPCEATLHGTVRDAGGGVVPRARVSREYSSTSAGADADDSGNYELCVPVGETTLVARAEGYARATENLFAVGRIRRDFELGPEATIAGRTVRSGDHAPVPNALIELRDASFRTDYGSSDSTGHFVFANLSPGRYSIVATADELATIRATDTIAAVGHTTDEAIELASSYQISGRVVETGTQTGIPGVSVRAQINGPQRLTEAITQADGSFAIDHALPGEYKMVIAQHDIHDPQKLVVTDRDVSGVTLEVDKLASIAGIVTRAGKAVDGASISAGRSYATSAADGTFTIANLKPGTYDVGGDSKRIGAFSKGLSITVAAGEQRTGVGVELDLAGAISGVVVDQHDAPVPGVFVSFSLVEGRDFGIATTADDGSFHARALSGGGTYKYEVHATERSPIVYRPVDGDPATPIAVADGNTRIEGVRIRIQVDRLTISGHVLDAHDHPIADMTVRAVPVGRFGSSVPTATTNSAGAFTLHDLTAGNYDLGLRGAEGEAHEEAVKAGRTDVVLRVAGLGSIDGTLTGFTDPPEIAVVQLTRVDRVMLNSTVTGATFHVRDVPAGRYYVIAKSKTGVGLESVAAIAGQATQTTIRQLAVGSIEGTIRDASGAPIANATCTVSYRDSMFDLVARQTNAVLPARSDSRGAFRFDKVLEGSIGVTCKAANATATGSGRVVPDQATRLELQTSL